MSPLEAQAEVIQARSDRNERLLLRLGHLNYVWSNTESMIIYVIAHLMATSKEAAIVTFLTLNTTRARLDLVERLAKLPSARREDTVAVNEIVTKMKTAARLRNKFSHCVFSVDANGDLASTQLMKIADIGDNLRYGKVEKLDDREIARIDETVRDILAVNRDLWRFLQERRIAA